MNYAGWQKAATAVLGPGDFSPPEPTRAQESDADFLMHYVDAVSDTRESLIKELQRSPDFAETLCEFIAWATDHAHPKASEHIMRLAAIIDRDIRRSADRALRARKDSADTGEFSMRGCV